MRILYLINYAGKAGTEKYVLNLVKYCKKNNIECFLGYNQEGLLLTQTEDLGIKAFQIVMKNPFDIAAAKKLAQICKDYKIDIIHAQYPRENYIALLAKRLYKKVKVIYTCHLTMKTGALWKITNKIMTKHNDLIISVCNKGRELMIENGVCAEKIVVIFNGIEHTDDDTKSTVREELSIPDDAFVITTLARYNFMKGLPFLVSSIKQLDKIIKRDYRVLIAGDGELFDEIKEQIAREGLENKILQLGFRSDTDNILKGSDIFVNSAKCHEALSFAILEAMNRGLPIVATNIGGNGDIVNDKTNCGFLVEYGNETQMANAINNLSLDSELYKNCSQNSVRAVKEIFDLDKLLGDIINKYKELTKER